MKKSLLFMILGLLSTTLFAFSDADMDGVADSVDKCPNTPFMDLVDVNGCSIKSLKTQQHYDIIVGESYSDSDYVSLTKTDTFATTLQVDYYYKNFSLQASSGYFTTNGDGYSDSGMQDSYLGGAYNFKPLNALTLRIGAVAILPTYDSSLNNNKTDYSGSLNISYSLGKVNLFGGYAYTMVNDTDYLDGNNSIYYQNTNAYNVGVGVYATNKLYISLAYNNSNSIYKGIEDTQTASIYGYYSLTQHWFATLNYAYGISDTASKNYAAIRVGYYF